MTIGAAWVTGGEVEDVVVAGVAMVVGDGSGTAADGHRTLRVASSVRVASDLVKTGGLTESVNFLLTTVIGLPAAS